MIIHDDNITLEDLDFASEKGFNRGIEYVAVRILEAIRRSKELIKEELDGI